MNPEAEFAPLIPAILWWLKVIGGYVAAISVGIAIERHRTERRERQYGTKMPMLAGPVTMRPGEWMYGGQCPHCGTLNCDEHIPLPARSTVFM